MGTRVVVNASPEPFSNIAVSSGEDIATGGLLLLVLANPVAAVAAPDAGEPRAERAEAEDW